MGRMSRKERQRRALRKSRRGQRRLAYVYGVSAEDDEFEGLNRQQRRIRARTEQRMDAAETRAECEGRLTREGRLLEEYGVENWDDLTEAEKEDIIEESTQTLE